MVEPVNRQKYLVTWVESAGEATPQLTRGQATGTIEEAARMYDHVTGLDTTIYCEVRQIGGLAMHSNGGPMQFERKPN